MEEVLPFDVDGEESLHISGTAAHCGSKGFSLAVAEEKHLKHMRVIDRHTTAGYLPVAILESHRKILPHYDFLPFSIFEKTPKQPQNADWKWSYYHVHSVGVIPWPGYKSCLPSSLHGLSPIHL